MNAQCTMQGCGQLILGPTRILQPNAAGPTQLADATDAQEYAALETAIVLHFAQYHPDICAPIQQATARYAAALFTKMCQSVDPRFEPEQYESFKLLWWTLTGTLHTSKTAGRIQFPPKPENQAPGVTVNQA